MLEASGRLAIGTTLRRRMKFNPNRRGRFCVLAVLSRVLWRDNGVTLIHQVAIKKNQVRDIQRVSRARTCV